MIQTDTQAQLGTFATGVLNFGGINTVDPQLRNPYVQQYSLGMEYQFGRSFMFGLSYIGSKGTHLTRLIPINPVVNGSGSGHQSRRRNCAFRRVSSRRLRTKMGPAIIGLIRASTK